MCASTVESARANQWQKCQRCRQGPHGQLLPVLDDGHSSNVGIIPGTNDANDNAPLPPLAATPTFSLRLNRLLRMIVW